ncbi:MAG: hypothetical protein QM731_16085 [Chitinophagaceae bacterium]
MCDVNLPKNVFASFQLPQKLPAIEARYTYVKDILIPLKLFLPCQLKLLIVTDGSGSFDTTASFGLGHFLKVFTADPANVATDNPASYVRFTVKTAHRGGLPADFTNFKFDTHALKQYDQIWLFGVDAFGAALTDKELKAIATFMNEGGGVFATGDHEDLGVKMCGSLPRIRCMRRWWFTTPDPLGSPAAPPSTGTNHNTITDNPATPVNEEGVSTFQSDNYPQNIFPRYRRVWSGPFLRKRVFPHPLLCGPNGVIKVMPDHMHEGRCDIYNDFARTLTFDSYSFKEFPDTTGTTSKELPKVIADNLNQLTNLKFESISVYDGHNTDKAGRIVCDATWHHFFNINLIGFEASRARVRGGIGNAEDARAENDYKNIRAYYRNIAYWISRRADQTCMRNKGIHLVVHDFDLKIAYKPLKYVKDKLAYFLYWGELAKDSLNQLAPQCQWYEWIIIIVKNAYLFTRLRPVDDITEEKPDFEKWIDLERIQTIALGKAIYQLYEFIEGQKEITEKTYEKFEKVVVEGTDELLAEILSEAANEIKTLQKNLKK